MMNVATTANATVAPTATSWVHDLLRVAVDQARVGVDGRGGEDARGDGAERAAHAVDREHVERVVDAEPLAQQRRAVADPAGGETDERARRPRSRSPPPA